MYIEVLAAPPPGESPDWVREAWVGLTLPAKGPFLAITSGILTGPKRNWKNNRFAQKIIGVLTGQLKVRIGYAVNIAEALAVLEKHRPDAARWWRANLPTEIISARMMLFRFGLYYRVVPDDERQS